MKAIIYYRKSTDRIDRQQLSISSQIVEAKRIAEREGLEIVEIFKETKSAKEPGRPIFNEMMKLFSKRKANCIITWKLNRLARNPVDEGTIKWSLQNGVIQAIFTEGEVFRTGDNVSYNVNALLNVYTIYSGFTKGYKKRNEKESRKLMSLSESPYLIYKQ